MPKDIKPAYDYDQQLDNLRERGLLIPDADYANQFQIKSLKTLCFQGFCFICGKA